MIKLLYVEDEPNLAKIVCDTLLTRQFEVKHISQGHQAVQTYLTFKPDICILDVMLPHVDGYTIARQIRNLDSAIPIIFLTAKSLTEDVIDGFNAGGNDFLRKPFSMEELLVRIKNLLSMTSKVYMMDVHQDAIPIGQYSFYIGKQELIKDGKVKRLSHRETELLTMLVDKKQETIHRKNILDKIWGNDSQFNSRNLDVYITKLRDYLKEDENVQIITLKGVGYRLVY